MKILITGASGFVGKYLVKELMSEDNDLYGTYLNSSDEELAKKIKLTKLDLNDGQKVEELISDIKPELIFHLAASTSTRDSFIDPSATIHNNVDTQINILEAVRKNNIAARIMIVSSAEVYGTVNESDLPIDEQTPLNPSNPYAVSKIACDYLALQYFNSYKLDIVRLRPFNHTGPGQAPNFVVPTISKKIAEIEKGKLDKLTVGNLESKRDFTDVRDMVKAYLLISQKGKSGEVYNIGSGRSHKISEILDILLSFSNKKITVEQDKSLLMPSDNPNLVCDHSKLSSITDWEPLIPLEQTLKETLDYWRSVV